MGVLNSESFVVLKPWMVEDLHLKGSEINIYAAIYGFSCTKGQWCTCSQEYLAAWGGCSDRTVRNILASLAEKGLIEIKQNGKGKKYRAIPYSEISAKKEEEKTPEKISGIDSEHRKNFPPIPEKISDNNIDIYINTSKKERKKPGRKSYNDIIDSMIEDEELKAELIEYIKWRKMAKKTLTNHILEGLLQQLLSISSDPKKLVGIVRKSMFNGWAEFYPPAPPKVFTDNNQKPSTQIAKFNNFSQREGVEFDELEKALFFGKGRLDE